MLNKKAKKTISEILSNAKSKLEMINITSEDSTDIIVKIEPEIKTEVVTHLMNNNVYAKYDGDTTTLLAKRKTWEYLIKMEACTKILSGILKEKIGKAFNHEDKVEINLAEISFDKDYAFREFIKQILAHPLNSTIIKDIISEFYPVNAYQVGQYKFEIEKIKDRDNVKDLSTAAFHSLLFITITEMVKDTLLSCHNCFHFGMDSVNTAAITTTRDLFRGDPNSLVKLIKKVMGEILGKEASVIYDAKTSQFEISW